MVRARGACLQRLHDRELVRRFLFRDRRYTFAAGGKGKLRLVIERTTIRAGTDRNSRNNLAGFSVQHHEHLVVTRSEQSMMHRIQRDTGWFFARRDRPARHYFVLRRVDRHRLALVFEIAVNTTRVSIRHGELRSSTKCDRAYHLRTLRLDHRH